MYTFICVTLQIHTCHCVGDLQRGESLSCQRGNVVASVWRDRKLVYVMSTNSDSEGSTTVQRKERDGSAQMIPCPPNVVAYNKYMGGVDRSDQLWHYYRVRCKTRKFYRYIFWLLFDSSVVNAFILTKGYSPTTARQISSGALRTG